MKCLESLRQYKTEHGHVDVDVPRAYTDYPKLGQWVTTMRIGYRNYKAGNQKLNWEFVRRDEIMEYARRE